MTEPLDNPATPDVDVDAGQQAGTAPEVPQPVDDQPELVNPPAAGEPVVEPVSEATGALGQNAGSVTYSEQVGEDGELVQSAEAIVIEDDEDGDPEADDLGAAEEPSETDPAPLLNDDSDDDFSDLEDGEDDGDDEALEGDDDGN